MREKLLWAVVLILGVAFTTSRAQAPEPALASRFQLFVAGEFVYRIDTQTGRTCLHLRGSRQGQLVNEWRVVEETASPSEATVPRK
jgi:hypothetical protein